MSGTAYREGSWTAPHSGHLFAYRAWQPSIPARALVVIIHGFGEHGGRYRPVGQALAEQGICVVAPDLWAHGRSGGSRGDLGDLGEAVSELVACTEQVLLPLSGQQTYTIYGHSFGGLAAIVWLLDHQAHVRRAVIQSPLLEVAFQIPAWKRIGASVLARCWPSCALSMDLDTTRLSHDPAVIQAYRDDPLVHNRMSARTYHSLLESRDRALRDAARIQVPTLLLDAGDDQIISTAWAARWFDRLVCPKRRITFPESYHELHHESVRTEVLGLVTDWALELT